MSDDRFLETLREEFTPEPTSPARAAELRRELMSRIDRPARTRFAWPALASAAAAAAVLYLAWPNATPTVTPDDNTVAVAESDSLVDPDAYASELADSDDYLPADYQGLALLLDDDTADR